MNAPLLDSQIVLCSMGASGKAFHGHMLMVHSYGSSYLMVTSSLSFPFFLLSLCDLSSHPLTQSEVLPSPPLCPVTGFSLTYQRLLGSILYSTMVNTMPMVRWQPDLGVQNSASEYTVHKTDPCFLSGYSVCHPTHYQPCVGSSGKP